MITLSDRLEVDHTPDAVWTVLSDPYAVVQCVPGARLTSVTDTGEFEGNLVIRFGPMRVPFHGRGRFDLSPEQCSGNLTARGADDKGGARFQATMHFQLRAAETAGAKSVISLEGRVDLMGKLAGMIERGAATVVSDMMAEFVIRLAQACSLTSQLQPADADLPVLRFARRWSMRWLVSLRRVLRVRLRDHPHEKTRVAHYASARDQSR